MHAVAPQRGALANLLAILSCPNCGERVKALAAGAEVLDCLHCGSSYSIIESGAARIPWLFADPDNVFQEWKARFNGFLCSNLAEQARLKRALRDERIGLTSRDRITGLLRARETHREQIWELLTPLQFGAIDFAGDGEPANILRSKLPKNHGLLSYYSNIFRDWAWENGENDHLLGAVDELLPAESAGDFGKVLTLGAGACRLSYDLHRKYGSELSVVLDINPLLIILASRVIQGETVPLFEFPVSPLSKASCAALQECRAPEALPLGNDGGFFFALADGMNLPFAPGSFDTLLTPWLIDIIPQDLNDFIPRVNRMLGKNGVWLNTGTLAFFHKDETWCYSEEEVLELLQKNGFELITARRHTMPYLQSPLSAHGRRENVFSFSARKIRDVAIPSQHEYVPEWIVDKDKPVPDLTDFAVISARHLLNAQVLGAIDGKRSIEEIGRLVAKQHGLLESEATHAVRRILIDQYEDNLFQKFSLPGG